MVLYVPMHSRPLSCISLRSQEAGTSGKLEQLDALSDDAGHKAVPPRCLSYEDRSSRQIAFPEGQPNRKSIHLYSARTTNLDVRRQPARPPLLLACLPPAFPAAPILIFCWSLVRIASANLAHVDAP